MSAASETDFPRVLRTLTEARIDFIVIGAVAAISHGEVAGGGTFEQLKPFAEVQTAFGVRFLAVGLDKLIVLKRAAGRPKDFEMEARLEAARQEKIAANQNARTISDPGAA